LTVRGHFDYLLGGFGRAKTDGFLHGRRQFIDLMNEIHLLLLFAGLFRPRGRNVGIHRCVSVTSLIADNHPVLHNATFAGQFYIFQMYNEIAGVIDIGK